MSGVDLMGEGEECGKGEEVGMEFKRILTSREVGR